MSDAPESGAARPVSLPLHRVRFVDWTPSSITALAFSPVPPAAQSRCVLAVGRENGNIDLCTWCEDASADVSAGAPLARGWMIEHTLFGDVNYKIEALAFTRTYVDGADVLRLFSTSGGSVVTEHFLPPHMALIGEDMRAKLRVSHTSPTRTLPSHGGAIWSMAASPLGHYLAIGCEDGIVRLVDVRGDAFEHVHGARPGVPDVAAAPRMSRVASRILSLAWGPPRRVVRPSAKSAPAARDDDSSSDEDSESEDDGDNWRESFLLGGLGNSSAAVWDVATGQLRSRLALLKNRSEHTIVWSVAVLSDGTLVTGDSTGRVTFFDARTRVPIPGATFQCHTSGADVLALCIGSDGRAVYSAGVDQKVAEYTLVGHTWAHTATRRLHAHDIRALAMDPPFDPRGASTAPGRLPVLVSGGIDFHLVLTPAAPAQRTSYANPISSSVSTRFADTTQRRVPFVPQNARAPIAGGAVLSVCAARRWLVLRRDTSVAIWALGTHEDAPWHKVSELQLKTRSNLIAATVSPDGRYLAASDLYETKLFALNERDGVLAPRRVRTLGAAIHGTEAPAPGASVLTFTPDSTRLVLGTLHGAYLHVVQLSHADEVQLLRSFTQHRQRHTPDDGRHGRVLAGDARVRGKAALVDDTARDVFATLVLAHVSPDGQWLVSVDSARRMHVFHLDTLSHQRLLASPASLPTAACFHPERPHVLVVTLPTNQLALYDMDAGAPAGAWERELRAQFDTHLAKVREPVVGCAWLPGAARQEATLVLYGPTWITTARHTSTPPASAGTKRRGTAPGDTGAGWVVRSTFKYQPLLAVHAFPHDTATELLVVERPYFALAQSLPPSFYRGAKYGF
ncbi:U3 small nucleolar RNA-associated protein [Malassezia brasiliensis]|uniref:U3 small nucleolar RNA-associated protein n=1 Tax=Malassezia brasiliensis TaxID=1821822 RepID=A0AAF0ING3_9BASI|nr:U3 small nucleolar RNA-associated protein [Malassezia brasiliensis]